jgi:hypothetical protein
VEITPRNRQFTPAALSLGLAALLFAAFPLTRPFFPLDPRSPDALGIASPAITSLAWLLSHFLLLAAFLLLMFGLMGLYAELARGEESRPLGALVLSLAGVALVLPMVGVELFAMPPIGRVFLAEHSDVGAAFNEIYLGPGTITMLVGLFLLAVGAFFFAVLLWRSDRFSGLAGFIFALGLALWFPLFPKMIRIMDGLLIGIGGVWIAFIMARRK